MKAYQLISRRVNAVSADGYSEWNDGQIICADSAEEAKEAYLDDLSDCFGYDVRKTGTNEFGNPVDYQFKKDGKDEQYQLDTTYPDYMYLSDEELAEVFKKTDQWELELCKELVIRAGIIDDTIVDEWNESNGDDAEAAVLNRAADILGINIF